METKKKIILDLCEMHTPKRAKLERFKYSNTSDYFHCAVCSRFAKYPVIYYIDLSEGV